MLKGVLAFALLAGAAVPLNYWAQAYAVASAKAYPAQVAPLLEAYRQAHGAYPLQLNQLPSSPPLPRLLRAWGYHSDGETYTFTFPQPGGMIDTWGYDSQTGNWELST